MSYETLFALQEQYFEMFGDVYPSMQIKLSERRASKLIKRCLREKKPVRAFIKMPDDVTY